VEGLDKSDDMAGQDGLVVGYLVSFCTIFGGVEVSG